MRSIDLNCDLGEYEALSEGMSDKQIMPYISSCNIACGGHAGNQAVIDQTIDYAMQNQVSMGAHPSYPDRVNFGRQVMVLSQADLKASLKQQILTIKAAVEAKSAQLQHVKLHGALYNQVAIDLPLAVVVAELVAEIDPNLHFFGLAHSKAEVAAEQVGLRFVAEGFADRAYTDEKTLVARSQLGACIESPDEQLHQVLTLLKHNEVKTINGKRIHLEVDTLCLHGDHRHAIETARKLNLGIRKAGFLIKNPG